MKISTWEEVFQDIGRWTVLSFPDGTIVREYASGTTFYRVYDIGAEEYVIRYTKTEFGGEREKNWNYWCLINRAGMTTDDSDPGIFTLSEAMRFVVMLAEEARCK